MKKISLENPTSNLIASAKNANVLLHALADGKRVSLSEIKAAARALDAAIEGQANNHHRLEALAIDVVALADVSAAEPICALGKYLGYPGYPGY